MVRVSVEGARGQYAVSLLKAARTYIGRSRHIVLSEAGRVRRLCCRGPVILSLVDRPS